MIFLALFLGDPLEGLTLAADAPVIERSDRRYVDVCEAWTEHLSLGFYDWLRARGSGEIIGVQVILHDGRERLRTILPACPSLTWVTADILRVRFAAGEVDEASSVDQEFTTSRCLVADDGAVALLFAVDLPARERDPLAARFAPARA